MACTRSPTSAKPRRAKGCVKEIYRTVREATRALLEDLHKNPCVWSHPKLRNGQPHPRALTASRGKPSWQSDEVRNALGIFGRGPIRAQQDPRLSVMSV